MGVETLPSATVSVVAESVIPGSGLVGSGLSAFGENSLSIPVPALSSLPDSGGTFMPGFTVEDLKSMPKVSFGTTNPSLDTYFAPSTIESSVITIDRPKSVDSLDINLNAETIATRPTIPGKLVKEAPEAIVNLPEIDFPAKTLSYSNFEAPAFLERDMDDALSQKIKKFIQTSDELSAEDQLVWKQKLKTIMEQKVSAVETKTQTVSATETETAVVVEPRTQTSAKKEIPPPAIPTATMLDELPAEETVKDEEGDWKVYTVDQKWVVARDILKQRLEFVNRAIHESAGKSSAADAVRDKIADLDIPSLGQFTKITNGELVIPQVVAKIDHALGFVDENDIETISSTAQEIVQKNTPQQKNKLVRFVEKIKQSQLVRPARVFAELGAKYIVLKRETAKWEAEKRLRRTEPIELEKDKSQGAVDIFTVSNRL